MLLVYRFSLGGAKNDTQTIENHLAQPHSTALRLRSLHLAARCCCPDLCQWRVPIDFVGVDPIERGWVGAGFEKERQQQIAEPARERVRGRLVVAARS